MVIKIVPKYKHNDMLQLLLASSQRTSMDIIMWTITVIDLAIVVQCSTMFPLTEGRICSTIISHVSSSFY